MTDLHEVAGGSQDDETVVSFVNVFGAGVKGGHHSIFAGGAQFNPAFALELEHHGTGVGHTTAVLGEGVADFRHSTVFVIGGNLNNNPDAAGAVAFVNFFNQGSGGFVGDASDGALNVDLGHIGLASLLQHHGERGVHIGVGAAASSDGDLISDFGEKGAALGVNHGFLTFGSGPFTVS